MCFKITNLGSTFIEGEVWHKTNENSSPKDIFYLALTFMLNVLAVATVSPFDNESFDFADSSPSCDCNNSNMNR